MTLLQTARLPLFIAPLAGGCSALPDRSATLEARGALAGASDGNNAPYDDFLDQPETNATTVATANLDWRSYGLRASLNSKVVDVFSGIDRHDFDGSGATEVNLGLRLHSTKPGWPYIETALRRGFGLDTVAGLREYSGMAAGIGLIVPLDQNWFLDLACTLEWTLERWDLGDGEERLSDVLFEIGIGYVF